MHNDSRFEVAARVVSRVNAQGLVAGVVYVVDPAFATARGVHS